MNPEVHSCTKCHEPFPVWPKHTHDCINCSGVVNVPLTRLQRMLIARAVNTEMNLLVRPPFKTQHAALLVAMERIDR